MRPPLWSSLSLWRFPSPPKARLVGKEIQPRAALLPRPALLRPRPLRLRRPQAGLGRRQMSRRHPFRPPRLQPHRPVRHYPVST
jgi:hypothetical protein